MSPISAVQPSREASSDAVIELESAWSNYLVWLTFAVPGMAWTFEGQALGKPLEDSPVVTHDDYRTFVRESFLRNTRTFIEFTAARSRSAVF